MPPLWVYVELIRVFVLAHTGFEATWSCRMQLQSSGCYDSRCITGCFVFARVEVGNSELMMMDFIGIICIGLDYTSVENQDRMLEITLTDQYKRDENTIINPTRGSWIISAMQGPAMIYCDCYQPQPTNPFLSHSVYLSLLPHTLWEMKSEMDAFAGVMCADSGPVSEATVASLWSGPLRRGVFLTAGERDRLREKARSSTTNHPH